VPTNNHALWGPAIASTGAKLLWVTLPRTTVETGQSVLATVNGSSVAVALRLVDQYNQACFTQTVLTGLDVIEARLSPVDTANGFSLSGVQRAVLDYVRMIQGTAAFTELAIFLCNATDNLHSQRVVLQVDFTSDPRHKS
jgi:hypothetical protein